eukprot:CAMPEP_0182883810 /NCGR_PEP_ID=MMETSP0034_2-20130328/18609_1 /TAXON_ID=156128 /ORGANISM="Nephroselmis pyriformis, Strain CCMP717" /LENGTH=136 /DNA_ID=CAMNT_0025016965 /DNA_START=1 /DNA_END=411 /DNA_ORIENTATION=-
MSLEEVLDLAARTRLDGKHALKVVRRWDEASDAGSEGSGVVANKRLEVAQHDLAEAMAAVAKLEEQRGHWMQRKKEVHGDRSRPWLQGEDDVEDTNPDTWHASYGGDRSTEYQQQHSTTAPSKKKKKKGRRRLLGG